MEVLIAFLVGVASSSAVALIVYRRQRREQLQSEVSLLRRIAQLEDLVGIAASTTLNVQGLTERLERDVSILRRQLTERHDYKETFLDRHFKDALELLPADGRINERVLKDVHRVILGPDFEYAGEFRDANVFVGGALSGIHAPEPNEVPRELKAVLEMWNKAIVNGNQRSREQWIDFIVSFHFSMIRVHPFFDGNGLMARVLLAIQTYEHLGTAVMLPRRDSSYFSALKKACQGDPEDLRRYLVVKIDATAKQQHTAEGTLRRV